MLRTRKKRGGKILWFAAFVVVAVSALVIGVYHSREAVSDQGAKFTSGEYADEGVIEIREKMFIAQTNDVYLNSPDYIGKTLRYEGMYNEYTDTDSGITYCSVVRYGPGCCSYDGNVGFEVRWGDEQKPYPNVNDWVLAEGVLEEYDEYGATYLRLNLRELSVVDTRGAEYVYQ